MHTIILQSQLSYYRKVIFFLTFGKQIQLCFMKIALAKAVYKRDLIAVADGRQ